MKQCMDAKNLHARMKKIIGQLNAIDKMIDKDIPCEDIIMQINAAKSALHKVGQVVLEGHLHHCVKEGIETNTLLDILKNNDALREQLKKMLSL